MLTTLSRQEKEAVDLYDKEIREGTIEIYEAWVDDIMRLTYRGFRSRDVEVIDIGCGTGRCVRLLEQLGFQRYLGIDPSGEAIRVCRDKFPKYEFSQDEIRTIGEHFPNRFDAFIIAAVLQHIPFEDLDFVAKSLRNCLKREAKGLLIFPTSPNSHRKVLTDGNLTISHFSLTETIEVFKRNGFVEKFSGYYDDGIMAYLSLRAI